MGPTPVEHQAMRPGPSSAATVRQSRPASSLDKSPTRLQRPNTALADIGVSSHTDVIGREQSKRKLVKTADNLKQHIPGDELEGWGDFDADELLSDRSPNTVRLDEYLGMRAREPKMKSMTARKSSPSTPIGAGVRSAPTSVSPALSSTSKDVLDKRSRVQLAAKVITARSKTPRDLPRPGTAVLRQRKLEAVEFDLAQDCLPPNCARRSELMRNFPHGVNQFEDFGADEPAAQSASASLLCGFLSGSSFPADNSTRQLIVDRLSTLWSWMPESGNNDPFAPLVETSRSTFECNMTVLKLCKTVGISVGYSSRMPLSLWQEHESCVGFDEFCEFVFCSILQPALHHFHLDDSIDNYASALGAVLDNLLAPSNPDGESSGPVLKELGDIRAIMPFWKTGISNHRTGQVDHSRTVTSDPNAGQTTPPVSQLEPERVEERDRGVSRLAATQVVEVAKETQAQHIQRMMQLRASWTRTPALGEGQLRGSGLIGSKSRVSKLKTQPDHRQDATDALKDQLLRITAAVPVSGQYTASPVMPSPPKDNRFLIEQPTSITEQDTTAERDKIIEDQIALICSSCSVTSAVLWCASCFSVFCQTCWESVHQSTVDFSPLHESMMPDSGSAAPFCPTVLPLRAKTNKDNGPSIPMIYLPTKPAASVNKGSLSTITKHFVDADPANESCRRRLSTEGIGVVSHSILPSVSAAKNAIEDSGTTKRLEHSRSVDLGLSMVELSKSLMLGAVKPHNTDGLLLSTGSRAAPGNAIFTKGSHSRLQLRRKPSRQTLHSSSVLLDASHLLPA